MQVRNFISLLAQRYLGFSNVLHIWSVQAIPSYGVYRLYDNSIFMYTYILNKFCTMGNFEESNTCNFLRQ